MRLRLYAGAPLAIGAPTAAAVKALSNDRLERACYLAAVGRTETDAIPISRRCAQCLRLGWTMGRNRPQAAGRLSWKLPL